MPKNPKSDSFVTGDSLLERWKIRSAIEFTSLLLKGNLQPHDPTGKPIENQALTSLRAALDANIIADLSLQNLSCEVEVILMQLDQPYQLPGSGLKKIRDQIEDLKEYRYLRADVEEVEKRYPSLLIDATVPTATRREARAKTRISIRDLTKRLIQEHPAVSDGLLNYDLELRDNYRIAVKNPSANLPDNIRLALSEIPESAYIHYLCSVDLLRCYRPGEKFRIWPIGPGGMDYLDICSNDFEVQEKAFRRADRIHNERRQRWDLMLEVQKLRIEKEELAAELSQSQKNSLPEEQIAKTTILPPEQLPDTQERKLIQRENETVDQPKTLYSTKWSALQPVFLQFYRRNKKPNLPDTKVIEAAEKKYRNLKQVPDRTKRNWISKQKKSIG